LPHTWYSAGQDPPNRQAQKSIVVQFLPAFLGEGFFGHPELQDVHRLLERSRRGLKFSGRQRQAVVNQLLEMEQQKPLDRLTSLLQILDRLSHCREARPLSSEQFAPKLRSAEHRRVDRVCSYLNEHFDEPITLAMLAEMTYLSESAFGRLFRRTTGKTFSAYLTELRIGAACKCLVGTEDRISDIAFRVGFENLSNFNRRFQAVKAVTPREYRAAFNKS
jgi:AraC-like DNA-binding protein